MLVRKDLRDRFTVEKKADRIESATWVGRGEHTVRPLFSGS